MVIEEGQWYTYCCEEDLQQAKTSFEDSDHKVYGPWGSREEALAAIEAWSVITPERQAQLDACFKRLEKQAAEQGIYL